MISPSSEHLFQVLNEQQLQSWVKSMQEATEEALKNSDPGRRPPPPDFTRSHSVERTDGGGSATVAVPNALNLILSVPGNRQCADCSSTTGESFHVCVRECLYMYLYMYIMFMCSACA